MPEVLNAGDGGKDQRRADIPVLPTLRSERNEGREEPKQMNRERAHSCITGRFMVQCVQGRSGGL